jgi:hypothetical protein
LMSLKLSYFVLQVTCLSSLLLVRMVSHTPNRDRGRAEGLYGCPF